MAAGVTDVQISGTIRVAFTFVPQPPFLVPLIKVIVIVIVVKVDVVHHHDKCMVTGHSGCSSTLFCRPPPAGIWPAGVENPRQDVLSRFLEELLRISFSWTSLKIFLWDFLVRLEERTDQQRSAEYYNLQLSNNDPKFPKILDSKSVFRGFCDNTAAFNFFWESQFFRLASSASQIFSGFFDAVRASCDALKEKLCWGC